MPTLTYEERRGQLEAYFDRTAVEAWSRLTSDAPLGRIRATVRAGRDRMRETLLEWLPLDLQGCRILDAGCGTGLFSAEAARRGAEVVAVDISPSLIELARERTVGGAGTGSINFVVGDMLDPSLGRFDYTVAMDSLIHYRAPDMVRALSRLAAHTESSVLFTFAPRTPALTLMHTLGRLFPRGNRAPAIEPVSKSAITRRLAGEPSLAEWTAGRSLRIVSGFYTSQALELSRA